VLTATDDDDPEDLHPGWQQYLEFNRRQWDTSLLRQPVTWANSSAWSDITLELTISDRSN
jgi:hypothetical protein